MASSPPLTLGSRGSPLALAQANLAARALERAHGWDSGAVAIRVIRTSGDRIQDRPLADIGGKALWTKELELALHAGEIDAAVHSMKDVESERPGSLAIAATLERGDVRDRLVGAGSIGALPHGARVGTSSPRRTAQLLRCRPDLRILPIRGNVETRLARMQAGAVDATLLAAAGLDRLGRGETGAPVPVEAMLPAPAQAAIGIECRSDNRRALGLLGAIDHRPTHRAIAAERACARALGASCYSPVAALALERAGGLWLRVEILSADGAQHAAGEAMLESDALGPAEALARQLLEQAPDAVRVLFAR